jgi:HEAT repeat protein
MDENARKAAGDQLDASIWKRKAGVFSLWDAFDLVYEENGLSNGLKEILDLACKENSLPEKLRVAFSLAFKNNHPPDMLKSLIDLACGLDLETQAVVLRARGEMGKLLSDGPARGVIAYFLARHLDHPHAEVRQAAVEAVGMLTRQVLTDALAIKLTSDESVGVRKASAEALGELTVFPPLPALKEALEDEDWEVRATAIQALGRLGERLIIEPLKGVLEDEDFSVRSAALHALATFKGSLTTDYLVSVAQNETNDWITREAAVTALERAMEYSQAKTLRKKLDRELHEEFLAFPVASDTNGNVRNQQQNVLNNKKE